MEIVWSPKNEIERIDKIRLIDNRCSEKEVSLVFKSIDTSKETEQLKI